MFNKKPLCISNNALNVSAALTGFTKYVTKALKHSSLATGYLILATIKQIIPVMNIAPNSTIMPLNKHHKSLKQPRNCG